MWVMLGETINSFLEKKKKTFFLTSNRNYLVESSNLETMHSYKSKCHCHSPNRRHHCMVSSLCYKIDPMLVWKLLRKIKIQIILISLSFLSLSLSLNLPHDGMFVEDVFQKKAAWQEHTPLEHERPRALLHSLLLVQVALIFFLFAFQKINFLLNKIEFYA